MGQQKLNYGLIKSLYYEGMTHAEIAEVAGSTPGSINKVLHKLGLTTTRAGNHNKVGAVHNRAKLEERHVIEILTLRIEGLTYKEIAEKIEVKVTSSTIGEIIRGVSWNDEKIPGIKAIKFLRNQVSLKGIENRGIKK